MGFYLTLWVALLAEQTSLQGKEGDGGLRVLNGCQVGGSFYHCPLV